MDESCELCQEVSIDSITFETGHNLDDKVLVPLCTAHLAEAERDSAFTKKYYKEIEACFINSRPEEFE